MIGKEVFMDKRRLVIGGVVFLGLVGLSFVYKYFRERELYVDDSSVMYAFIGE